MPASSISSAGVPEPGFVQGDTGRDNRRLVFIRLVDYLAATDGELLIRGVEHRSLFAGGTHIDDAIMIGHFCNQLRGLVRVRRVEYCTAKDGTHHCEVF